MNQIKGIDQVATKIREHVKDPEYRRACIRDYIIANPGKPIKMTEFSRAAYGYTQNTGGVSVILKQLMRAGRVTRTKVPGGGKARAYTWHEQRLPKDPDRSNGPVVVVTKPLSSGLSNHFSEVIQLAKDFSWEHDSDSLREFIKTLQGGNDDRNE